MQPVQFSSDPVSNTLLVPQGAVQFVQFSKIHCSSHKRQFSSFPFKSTLLIPEGVNQFRSVL